MTHRFLVSAAVAALIAGTNLAYAQGTGATREAPSGGSTIQQSVPATSGSADRGDAATPPSADLHMRSTESYERLPRSGDRAQDTTHGDRSKTMRSETDESGKADKSMRAEEHNGKAGDLGRSAEEHNGMKPESSKRAVDNRSPGTTTGQAGASAKLSTEQWTKITTVIRNRHVEPATNINFSISIGARVPRSVSFHPLPTEIVDIYPSWRGYEFFLVRDEIIVVDPRTLEIVAVLDA